MNTPTRTPPTHTRYADTSPLRKGGSPCCRRDRRSWLRRAMSWYCSRSSGGTGRCACRYASICRDREHGGGGVGVGNIHT